VAGTGAKRPRLVLAVACMVILLDALDLSITQVALPVIRAELQVSQTLLPWVVNAYVLTYGGLLLFGGRVVDLLGRRATLFAGLAVFGAGSFACGVAPTVGFLIAARAIQGVGAALTVPAAVAAIAATFEQGPPRDRALGVFGACGSAGFSLGLVLGGALTSVYGWPAIFLVKVPVVVLVLAGAVVAVPASRFDAAGPRVWDVSGAVLGTVGLLMIAFAVTSASSSTGSAGTSLGSAIAGLLLLGGFLRVERRAPAPLLPLTLFDNRTVSVGDLASLAVLAAPFGVAFVVSTYLQTVLGWSPLQTGIGLLPGGALSVVVSRWLAPMLIGRLGLRASGSAALLVVAVGFAGLALVRPTPSYLSVVLPASLVCLGLGMGVAYPVYTVAAVTDVPESSQGVAAGVQNTALQIGGGVGLAIVSAVVSATAADSTDPEQLTAGLRAGALAGCALPLLGAVLTAVFLRPTAQRIDSSTEPQPPRSNRRTGTQLDDGPRELPRRPRCGHQR
jgi:MFS family permease